MTILLVCTHQRTNPAQPHCGARGRALATALKAELARHPACGITLELTGCLGYCALGPNLKIVPRGRYVHGVTPDMAPALIGELLDAKTG